MAEVPPRVDGEPTAVLLSNREREVLTLIAQGLSDQEIAEQLVLSRHTVHRHVANIRHKLGRGTRSAAVAEAARLGLLYE
jgi:ATP/maltotriose-dependent transcriptional regulator MalT